MATAPFWTRWAGAWAASTVTFWLAWTWSLDILLWQSVAIQVAIIAGVACLPSLAVSMAFKAWQDATPTPALFVAATGSLLWLVSWLLAFALETPVRTAVQASALATAVGLTTLACVRTRKAKVAGGIFVVTLLALVPVALVLTFYRPDTPPTRYDAMTAVTVAATLLAGAAAFDVIERRSRIRLGLAPTPWFSPLAVIPVTGGSS